MSLIDAHVLLFVFVFVVDLAFFVAQKLDVLSIDLVADVKLLYCSLFKPQHIFVVFVVCVVVVLAFVCFFFVDIQNTTICYQKFLRGLHRHVAGGRGGHAGQPRGYGDPHTSKGNPAKFDLI